MLLGIISDTHDRVPATEAILARFGEAGVQMILHAGDHCSPFSLMPFLRKGIPMVGVFGRNDGDHEALRAQSAAGMGVELYESPHSVDVMDRRLLLVHDIGEVAETSMAGHAIVVHGNSHSQEMKTRGDTLIINPGEGCGWIHGAPSAALLDLDTLHVEFIKLNGAEWAR